MKIYNYDRDTKEYTDESIARENPLEKGKYLVPANATSLEVLPAKDGFAVCFNKALEKWEYMEDNRGQGVYAISDKKSTTVDYMGALKDGFTKLKPDEFSKWEVDRWVENTEMKLIDTKSKAIANINTSCKNEIISGFISSALGVEHFYESEETDQLNLVGAVSSGIAQPFKCSGDNGQTWGYEIHTADQLKQLLQDGAVVKATHLQKANQLKDEIAGAATLEQLEAIAW